MIEKTPTLSLPLLQPAQTLKYITLNEAILKLDRLVQARVISSSLIGPPLSPEPSDSYIVAAGAVGDWQGHAGEIATFVDGVWSFLQPSPGFLVWVETDNHYIVYGQQGWNALFEQNQSLALLGINTATDPANRLSAASENILFSHDGDDIRLKLNRASSPDTASLLFQTNYSGRAELSTSGDDKFRVKVSNNGTMWSSALTIDPVTSYCGINAETPDFPLDVGGIIASSAAFPGLYLSETDQPADNRTWRLSSGGGVLSFQTLNDNRTLARNALIFQRDDIDVTQISLLTKGGTALVADEDANVGIGQANPSTRLHVNGPVRLGQYAVTALPSANQAGAGSIIFVTDTSGGAQLAYSDGTDWRKASDLSVI